MKRLTMSLLAVAITATAAVATSDRLQAAVIAPLGLRQTADELRLIETVQFRWGGHRYCWYSRGWRGAGWYRCGFAWRRGMGWGGPPGWHGWRHPGHRPPPVVRPRPPGRPGPGRPPGRPGRPGVRPLPAPAPR